MATAPRPDSARGTPFAAASLVDLLRFRAVAQPRDRAYTFLDDGETEGATLTWSELDTRARVIGGWLQDRLTPGDRALLMYPPGLEFVAAFFGCLYAGVVAVPVLPPGKGVSRRGMDRVLSIARSAEPAAVLMSPDRLGRVWTSADLTGDTAATRPMLLLRSDTLDAEWSARWTPLLLSRDSLGLLQFTSGSTSSPRGVMVTHGNLLHNLMSGFVGGETDRETVSVSWLPVTHDMGLIEGVLQPAFSGCPAYLMSPGSFLQRPMRWLTAMSRYRATRSGGPNFAYDLAVSRVTDAERLALDLSHWTSAYNGAEPVRADTMTAFAEAYRPSGFRSSAFIPCYGLAESTLLVSHGRWDDARGTDSAVSCGAATSGTHVLIVDPVSDRVCRDGDLGEIRVAGPSVARGYWNDVEETGRVFVTMADSDERWLRTGDLGFLRNDQLYVTGRLKDLLIVRGAKHFPQDVERTTEALHPAILRGGVTAVAVASGVRGDDVVVIAEIDPRQLERSRPMADVMAAIREAIAEAHGIRLHAVALVRYGAVPKTTSGKPRRYLCRDAWLHGTLQPMAQWMAPRC